MVRATNLAGRPASRAVPRCACRRRVSDAGPVRTEDLRILPKIVTSGRQWLDPDGDAVGQTLDDPAHLGDGAVGDAAEAVLPPHVGGQRGQLEVREVDAQADA